MAEYPVPAGITERMLTLRTCGLAIPAAFTVPTDRVPAAALLLIPGSLFCDVNGDFPSWNSFPGTNAYLAHQLAERGIAVMRYAKAGPGTGTVVEDQAIWDQHRSWEGRVTIARGAIALFHQTLSEIGFAGPVYISGHSEGSVVASRLVAEYPSETRAAGVVLLSGPAVGILSVMAERVAREAPPEEREARVASMTAANAAIMKGEPIPNDLRSLGWIAGVANMPPEGHKYLADCERTDPCASAAAIGVRVLVVQGTNDDNVTMHDAERLMAARAGQPTELLALEGLSHTFKRVPPGTNQMLAFGWPGPCDESVADGVARWIGAA